MQCDVLTMTTVCCHLPQVDTEAELHSIITAGTCSYSICQIYSSYCVAFNLHCTKFCAIVQGGGVILSSQATFSIQGTDLHSLLHSFGGSPSESPPSPSSLPEASHSVDPATTPAEQ